MSSASSGGGGGGLGRGMSGGERHRRPPDVGGGGEEQRFHSRDVHKSPSRPYGGAGGDGGGGGGQHQYYDPKGGGQYYQQPRGGSQHQGGGGSGGGGGGGGAGRANMQYQAPPTAPSTGQLRSGHIEVDTLYGSGGPGAANLSVNAMNAPNNSTMQCGCENIDCPFCNLMLSVQMKEAGSY